MKGTKKTQNKKQTQDKSQTLDGDALQKEIEKYLKITEENKKLEEVDPKEEEALKKIQEERQNQLKELNEQKDIEGVFQRTLQLVNSNLFITSVEWNYSNKLFMRALLVKILSRRFSIKIQFNKLSIFIRTLK